MAPDAPVLQIALVSAGAGFIAITLRALSERTLFKGAVNFLMFTILLWMLLMTGDFLVAAVRGTLLSSSDRPMWSLLVIAGILTLTWQFFSALRSSKRKSAALIEQLPLLEHSLEPTSRAALPPEQQKQLARR